MELGHLTAFIQVVRNSSFRKAADALFLTQPTVTSRIQALERELGEVLLERTTRHIRLTDAGSQFLVYAERAIKLLEDGKTALSNREKNPPKRIRIGTARTIGTYILPNMLRAYTVKYPEIEVIIRTGRSADVVDMLLNDEIDLGLGRFVQHPDITAIHLYNEPIELVTHPNHRFTKDKSISIVEVGQEPLILYDPGSFYYNIISNACQQVGIEPTVVMQLDSIEATKKMVELGLGISLLPRSSFEREQASGSLVQVDITEGFDVHLPSTILHRNDIFLSGPPRLFLDVIQGMFSN